MADHKAMPACLPACLHNSHNAFQPSSPSPTSASLFYCAIQYGIEMCKIISGNLSKSGTVTDPPIIVDGSGPMASLGCCRTWPS